MDGNGKRIAAGSIATETQNINGVMVVFLYVQNKVIQYKILIVDSFKYFL